MKKLLLMVVLVGLSNGFYLLEGMTEDGVLPGTVTVAEGQGDLIAMKYVPSAASTEKERTGSSGDESDGVAQLAESVDALTITGKEKDSKDIASPTVVDRTLGALGNKEDSADKPKTPASVKDERSEEKDDRRSSDNADAFDFDDEDVDGPKKTAAGDERKVAQKKRKAKEEGMSVFGGGSMASSLSNKIINQFFSDYSVYIESMLQNNQSVRYLGKVDSFSPKKQKKLAQCLISCLRLYINRDTRNLLFIKARKFFIDVFLPLAMLEHLHNNDNNDAKDIQKETKEIAKLSKLMVERGWSVLTTKDGLAEGLRTTVSGRILYEILSIRDGDHHARHRDRVIHFWLFFFHRVLVWPTDGTILQQKKKVLRSMMTVIHDAGFKLMQVVVIERALDKNGTPEMNWCKEAEDATNQYWYDTATTVQHSLAKKHCGAKQDIVTVATFIRESSGIEDSCCCLCCFGCCCC